MKRLDSDSYRLGLFSDYVAKCFDALGEYEAALSKYGAAIRCNCQDQPAKEIIIKRIAEIKENLPGRQ